MAEATNDQTEKNLPAVSGKPKPPVIVGERGIQLTSMDDLWRFAGVVAGSGLAPKGVERQESIFVAVQLGLELGISPMAALQNIAVINGRPGIFGDAALALVRNSAVFGDFEEWFEVSGKRIRGNPIKWTDDVTAWASSLRAGQPEERRRYTSFSVADAKVAGLWGKTGRDGQPTPWTTHPGRMMMFRARNFNLRDNFGDVLKGLRGAEEIQDDAGIIEGQVAQPLPIGRVSLKPNGNGNTSIGQSATDAHQEESPSTGPEAGGESKADSPAAPVDSAPDLDAEDLLHDIGDSIEAATNDAELKAAGTQMVKAQGVLGQQRYDHLLAAWRSKDAALKKGGAKKAATALNF